MYNRAGVRKGDQSVDRSRLRTPAQNLPCSARRVRPPAPRQKRINFASSILLLRGDACWVACCMYSSNLVSQSRHRHRLCRLGPGSFELGDRRRGIGRGRLCLGVSIQINYLLSINLTFCVAVDHQQPLLLSFSGYREGTGQTSRRSYPGAST